MKSKHEHLRVTSELAMEDGYKPPALAVGYLTRDSPMVGLER